MQLFGARVMDKTEASGRYTYIYVTFLINASLSVQFCLLIVCDVISKYVYCSTHAILPRCSFVFRHLGSYLVFLEQYAHMLIG